jgi:hypothetical protein
MSERQGGLVRFDAGSGMNWAQPASGYVMPARCVRDYGVEFMASLCICMQPWSSVTGRTCPVHGHIAPMQITC